MRPIIHSKKHYTQHSLETVAARAIVTDIIIDGVSAEAVGDVDEVAEGASVKAVYVEDWVIGATAAVGKYGYGN